MGRPDRQHQLASNLGHSKSARARRWYRMLIQILELKNTGYVPSFLTLLVVLTQTVI